jgi:histidine triad (HIT) family protein
VTACIFCEIIHGDRAAPRVFEDLKVVAFLDHRPLFPGHVLVVPREHLETMLDASPEALGTLFTAARRAGGAIEQALGAEGFLVAVNNRVSQSVPHLHVHVIPRTKGDGLKGFFWPRHPYRDAAHLEEVRAKIAAAATRGA